MSTSWNAERLEKQGVEGVEIIESNVSGMAKKKKKNKMSSDTGSVSGAKIYRLTTSTELLSELSTCEVG